MIVPAIETRNLRKAFNGPSGQDVVLDNFSCSLPEGRLTFITGPNGVGKTVLAKCILGLLPIDEGEIILHGAVFSPQSLCRAATRRAGIDYLPQDLPRPSSMSIEEFLALQDPDPWKPFSSADIRSGLNALSREYPALELHNPERLLGDLTMADLQHVYLAKALISASRTLILDEPTSYLSLEQANSLFQLLSALATSGVTIVVIAHPHQFAGVQHDALIFTSSGLISSQSLPNGRFCPPSADERYWPHTSARHSLTLGDGSVLAVRPGSIVSIEGASSRDFFEFSKCFASQPRKWLGHSNDSAAMVVRSLSFDASEASVAPDLSLSDNCLIDHWDDPEWTFAGMIVKRSRASEYLAKPILEALDVKPRHDIKLKLRHLSGGNIQRLIIGRSSHGVVDMFIACGLFRGLDSAGIDATCRYLFEKSRSGMTSFLLTTSMGLEQRIADERLLFRSGTLWKR